MMSPEKNDPSLLDIAKGLIDDVDRFSHIGPLRLLDVQREFLASQIAVAMLKVLEDFARAERHSSEELDALREEVEAYREAFDAAAEEDGEGFLKRVAAAHQLTERAKISEELASLKAERNALHRELSNIIPRFEKALAVTGSDPEFIVEATRRHRAALHPAGSGREEG